MIKIICLLFVMLIQMTRSDNVSNLTLVFVNETLNSTFNLNDAANMKTNHTSNTSSILEFNQTSTFELGKCFILYSVIIFLKVSFPWLF